MNINLTDLEKQLREEIIVCSKQHDVLQLKSKYLGKKGFLASYFSNLKSMQGEQKKTFGQQLNEVKNSLIQIINDKLEEIKSNESTSVFIDLDSPSRHHTFGAYHPISIIINRITNIFSSYGFDVRQGPEIETEFYNFEALNIPSNHPARDMHDTFYIDGKHLLRTHTSSVQIHAMQEKSAPLKILAPGKVYRCDSDPTHSPMFHQIEGLCIDKDISFSNLKWLLNDFIHKFFESKNIKTRFRPSYFPFTEPSAEMDIMFNGKWLEVLGCGMVHPNVLSNVNINIKKYSGFAFGLGIERFAMLSYQIKDLRVFFENDISFLEQFREIR